jgi:3-isopropylmalate dehydrogenase
MAKAMAADAVLFGAVGGPKWDGVPYDVRPEAGLLRLRKDLALFANLRPAICYPALADASSLKREVVEGLDILIVRELTGGVYFGEPKEIIDLGNGQKRGIDTQVYDTYEIERIAASPSSWRARGATRSARSEKRNVMKSGVLWNEVVTATHKPRGVFRRQAQPHARRCRRHAAGALAQAVRRHRHRQPVRRHAVRRRRDADRLARHAAVGLARRAGSRTGKRKALYEPVHGSAPDIAGKGIANPIAMIASFAMCLRYSFGLVAEADLLGGAGANLVGTDGMTAAMKALDELSA